MQDKESEPGRNSPLLPSQRVRSDGWALLTAAGLAVWFGATVASQHLQRIFDRFRDYDPTGLFIANWRFFTPEPAQHDFHVLHRVLTSEGTQTLWSRTSRIGLRSWRQMVWFPRRRREKALFDVCNELILHMATPGGDVVETSSYLMLQEFVEFAVRAEYSGRDLPRGFQFVIARHTGHDEEHDPDYVFVSPFVRLQELLVNARRLSRSCASGEASQARTYS